MDWTPYHANYNHQDRIDAPAVTIYKSGKMVFNGVAAEVLRDFSFAKLMYNAQERKIGLEPVNTNDDGALTITRTKTCKRGTIHLQGFLKSFDINIDRTSNRFLLQRDTFSNVFVIDLNAPVDESSVCIPNRIGEEVQS